MSTYLQKPNSLSNALRSLSVVLFIASLPLPAYVTYSGSQTLNHFGVEALLLGPIGFFAGHFAWLANLLLWASWAKRTQPGISPAFLLALLAFPAALLFPLSETVAVGSAGTYRFYVSVGYYLWLASMTVSAAAAYTYRQPSSAAAA